MDIWIPNESDAAFINRLIDPKSSEYSKDFSDKYQKLVEGEKTYKFESFEGNSEREGLFTENSDECTSLINFKTKADDEFIGGSEFRTLFEEVFHAVETDADPGHANSIEEEAEAHMFSALAPGTKTEHNDYPTAMGRILNANLGKVMGWMKNGMPSSNSGYGLNGGKPLYPNLPLFREPSKFDFIKNIISKPLL